MLFDCAHRFRRKGELVSGKLLLNDGHGPGVDFQFLLEKIVFTGVAVENVAVNYFADGFAAAGFFISQAEDVISSDQIVNRTQDKISVIINRSQSEDRVVDRFRGVGPVFGTNQIAVGHVNNARRGNRMRQKRRHFSFKFSTGHNICGKKGIKFSFCQQGKSIFSFISFKHGSQFGLGMSGKFAYR